MSLPVALLRLLLAALIAGTLAGVYFALSRLILSKASSGASKLAGYVAGLPAVVFFTTPACGVCKAAQRPALATLKQRLPAKVQIIEVDALVDRKTAREWSVLTVPTTFILDRKGVPRQVNQGFATAEKLLAQLRFVQ